MSANPWFRLYTEFAYDPKVQIMSEALQRRFIMLLCLRCSNGDETLHETFHETELAFYMRISDEELAETKRVFLAKGFIDERWNILNWDKRQFKSDSSTSRVSAYRERQKMAKKSDGNDVKRYSNVLDTDTDTDTDIKEKTNKKEIPDVDLQAVSDEKPKATQFAVFLRQNGFQRAFPEDVGIVDVVDKGATIALLDECIAIAKSEGKAGNLGYVLGIVRNKLHDATKAKPPPSKQKFDPYEAIRKFTIDGGQHEQSGSHESPVLVHQSKG